MRAGLRRLLDAHTTADEREAGFVDAMKALLELPGDPLSRACFTPGHFTASAFVLSPDGRALLLVHHVKLQRWLQPGGHLEPTDADLFAAARREVLEETGVGDLALPRGEQLFDVDVHDIPAFRDEPPHRHYDLRVLFRARATAVAAGAEVKAARWLELGLVSPEASDESVMRAVRKLLAA